jgi:hypothetical protein
VHAHNGRINHLHGRIMACGQRIHELVPHASPSPTNEAIVAGDVRAKALGQIAPWRTRTQNLKDAVEHAAVIYTSKGTCSCSRASRWPAAEFLELARRDRPEKCALRYY